MRDRDTVWQAIGTYSNGAGQSMNTIRIKL